MLLDVWVHRVTTSYLRSPLGADDGPLPLREVWEKCCDGLDWMAAFDRHPRAIDGLEAVARRAAEHATAGRRWRPWLVPHGRERSDDASNAHARAEGRRSGEVARAAVRPGERAVAILDVEPHYHGGTRPRFWRDDLGADAATVEALLDAFVQAGGEEVWVSVDAREPHLGPVAFETWWRHAAVTRVLPQVYWTDFLRGSRPPAQEDVRRFLDDALAALGARGVPASSIAPVFPGDSTPGLLVEAYAHAARRGTARPSLWQRLTLTMATARAIERMEDPWAVDLGAVRRRLEEASAALAAARAHLDAARTGLGG